MPYLNQIYSIILTKGTLQDTMKSKSKYKEKFNDSFMITYRMKVPYKNYFKASEQDYITVVQKMSKQQRRHYVTRITLS